MTASPNAIGALFGNDIRRTIEEVIKVDQKAEDVVTEEIGEYVVTHAIERHFHEVIEAYQDLWKKPGERMAVWVSGFFGSGKSSFAKMLGLALENKTLLGTPAAERFLGRVDPGALKALLPAINEQIPTHAVIFDVSTDRGIRSGNQTLTEIMYGLFLQSLGYAKDLDLAELEIGLETRDQLKSFKALYRDIYRKDWDTEKTKVIFAMSEASRVLYELDRDTYATKDSWVQAAKLKTDINPGKLASRTAELMARHRPGYNLLFVIDEVGQFVARDVQKMLDLQAIVQNLGMKSRGRQWVVITSQEKLGELVSGLDDKKIELARLMDRFPYQVHLEPSDISEVTSRRVLRKNAAAEATLGALYDQHRGRLVAHTRLTADIKLPELTRQGFIDLYPLLPYQIDLIIQVVSGLRTQGGASKHVGGANRTIIKLAQQLLVNPAVNLADAEVGQLARLDQVYDLVENNIASDIRAKVATIPNEVDHPLAQPVMKAICLLQFVKSVHRSADNIAAGLHPGVAADGVLPGVKDALDALVAGNKIRVGTDGYRIQTPAEDDWETARRALLPTPGEIFRVQQEALVHFWQPKPTHNLHDTSMFSAGLSVHGKELVAGDLVFDLHLTDRRDEFATLSETLRVRSQQEPKKVFWAVPTTVDMEREIIELHRSARMIASRGTRTALTGPETALLGEERVRERTHLAEVREHIRKAALAGAIYSRGHDRSPPEGTTDLGKAAVRVLSLVLPVVFDRFREAAAKLTDLKKAQDALFSAENLNGLPTVITTLHLLREEKGKAVFRTEAGPLKEVLARIENTHAYGDSASGRSLIDELGKEPFGWDLEAVRLFVMALVRAGKVELVSKGQTIESLQHPDAKEALSNNQLFKAAALRPKVGPDFGTLAAAAAAFVETFGSDVKELTESVIAAELRREVGRHEDELSSQLVTLQAFSGGPLPGASLLAKAHEHMKAILRGSDLDAVKSFLSAHKALKDGIKRAAELDKALTPATKHDLLRARAVLAAPWSFLEKEPDLAPELSERRKELVELLSRETFFRGLPAIDQHTKALESEYAQAYQQAVNERCACYRDALEKLHAAPGWGEVDAEAQSRIAASLTPYADTPLSAIPIPQLRADRDACKARLAQAMKKLHEAIEGERLVTVDIGTYFVGGVENEEQLDLAIQGLREALAALIGKGKKVVFA